MNIVVNNLIMSYRDEGEGPVVLVLHGWGSSGAAFDDLVPDLVKSWRVIRFDLPGFGGSQRPPLDWGVEDYAKQIVAVCDKLEIEPHGLIGHSAGGQISVHLVGSGMLVPKRLVLLAASAVRPRPGARERVFHAVAKIGKATIGRTPLGNRARERLYQVAGTVDYLRSGEMQAIYRRIITEDQTELARRIPCPTLLIWGDQDTDAPLSRGRLLASCIPGSRLEVLPGAGHFMFGDEPEKVSRLIKDFL